MTETEMRTASALADWADAFNKMYDMADGFFSSLNLGEAHALAELLACAGRPDLAAEMIDQWAAFDPEMAEERADEWQPLRDDYRQEAQK